MIFGPFGQTELYANAGYGFHSNDARGATITRDPSTGEPAEPRDAARPGDLGRGRRAEHDPAALAVDARRLGARHRLGAIFIGDAGSTEASRPSRRYGVEWSNYFRVLPWMTIDLDYSSPRRSSGTTPRRATSSPAPSRTSSPRASRSTASPTSSVRSGSATSGRGPRSRTTASARSLDHGQPMLGYEFVRGLRAQVESSTSSTRRSRTSTTSTRPGFRASPPAAWTTSTSTRPSPARCGSRWSTGSSGPTSEAPATASAALWPTRSAPWIQPGIRRGVLAREMDAALRLRDELGPAVGELARHEERVGAAGPGVLVPALGDAALVALGEPGMDVLDRLEGEAARGPASSRWQISRARSS